MTDLRALSGDALVREVFRALSAQIETSRAGLAVEIAGVRLAVAELADVPGKVDALISDLREERAQRHAVDDLARARIVDLEERAPRAAAGR